MNKLSFDAFKAKAEEVASNKLLNSISGGTENACHDSSQETLEDAASSTTAAEMYEKLKQFQ